VNDFKAVAMNNAAFDYCCLLRRFVVSALVSPTTVIFPSVDFNKEQSKTAWNPFIPLPPYEVVHA
jgi:hypothetical protein